MDDFLKIQRIKILSATVDDVLNIVETSDKKRYAVQKRNTSHGIKLYIRANQGHSKHIGERINDDNLLTLVKNAYPICIHGTTRKAWTIIKDKGLSSMRRKHVHLASGLSNDDTVISEMRNSSKVIIYINMQAAMNAGKTFYISDNGVILTPDHLEPELFAKVEFK